MPLKLKTAPAAAVLTVADVDEHCRANGDDDASYLQGCIDAVTSLLDGDGMLGRCLVNQTWYYYRQAWPRGDRFEIPLSPLVSVASITYKDTTGAVTTWDASNYIVDTASEPGQIVLVYSGIWPATTLYPSNPIIIEFGAGYGATADSVPADLRHHMKALVEVLYSHRGVYSVGQVAQMIQKFPLYDYIENKYRVRCNRED